MASHGLLGDGYYAVTVEFYMQNKPVKPIEETCVGGFERRAVLEAALKAMES